MATQRFISLINGVKQAITALVVSTGVSDGGKIVATDPATGKLDPSVMPSGIGAETDSMIADVGGLAAGDLVNIYNNAGTITARKADASSEGKPADGFVIGAVAAGSTAAVCRPGQTITGLTGLTAGVTYYLGTTAGQITNTPPASTGNVVQVVGIAASATSLIFTPGEPITLA